MMDKTARTPVPVVGALIRREDGRFLACRRPPHKKRGMLWEFVGGKIEPGETPEQALVRECREELGITVAVGPLYWELVHEYPDITVHLRIFFADIAEGQPQLLEHSELRWMLPAETVDNEFCPADAPILAALRAGEGLPR